MKNISRAGVQLKIYARPMLRVDALLRVADEPPTKGLVTWIKSDTAGISLDGEMDPASLLRVQQKLRPSRRRSAPRMSVEASAFLRTGGHVHRATVYDISSLGMRLRANAKLKAGERTIVEFADLPAISAFVRWSDGDEAGLFFETPIPMQIIARWTEDRFG